MNAPAAIRGRVIGLYNMASLGMRGLKNSLRRDGFVIPARCVMLGKRLLSNSVSHIARSFQFPVMPASPACSGSPKVCRMIASSSALFTGFCR